MKVLVIISSLRVAVSSLILSASMACLWWACVLMHIHVHVHMSTSIKLHQVLACVRVHRHAQIENMCEKRG